MIGMYFPEKYAFVSVLPIENKRHLMPGYVNPVCEFIRLMGTIGPSEISKEQAKSKPLAVILHAYHFAHHLWNELSAIEEILSNSTDNLTIFLLSTPFGPLEEIIGNYPNVNIINSVGKTITDVSIDALNKSFFWVPIGRLFIPSALINKLKTLSASLAPKDVNFSEQIRRRHDLILWVSIRKDTRVWLNQVEVMVKILDDLSNRYDAIAVIFDGMTPGFGGLVSERTINREQAIADEIFRRTNVNVTFISLAGASLQQAIVWSEIADVYIAHHGTIQHKIAWFQDVRGLCHYYSDGEFLREKFTALYAREGSHAPQYIMGTNGIADSRGNDPRKDLFSYDIDTNEIINKLMELCGSVSSRGTMQHLTKSEMHHLNKEYYNRLENERKMSFVESHLASANKAWSEKKVEKAFSEFSLAFSIFPKSKKVIDRILGFMILNYVVWLRDDGLAVSRVRALFFFLSAIDKNNSFVRERLLSEIFEVDDLILFEFMLIDAIRHFPDWVKDANESLLKMERTSGGEAIKLEFARREINKFLARDRAY
jgi:hypothetical protein